MAKAHPGFKAVQGQIASREGVSEDRAGAILAASSRNASAAAKRKNPRLKRVAGKPRKSKQPKLTTAYNGNGGFRDY